MPSPCNPWSQPKSVELRTILDERDGPIAGKATRYALSKAGQTLCFTRYWRFLVIESLSNIEFLCDCSTSLPYTAFVQASKITCLLSNLQTITSYQWFRRLLPPPRAKRRPPFIRSISPASSSPKNPPLRLALAACLRKSHPTPSSRPPSSPPATGL